MRRGVGYWFVLVGMLLMAVTSVASGAENGRIFIAGGSVRLDGPVAGDLYMAGGSVRIDEPIGRDAIVAGGSVRISAAVVDDLWATGGALALGGDVGGRLIAAGGNVVIGPSVNIGGPLRVAAGSIDIVARVGGKLQVAAQSVSLSGEFAGDVDIAAERIRIGPHTRIAGNLRWFGSQPPEIDPSAVIAGSVTNWERGFDFPLPQRDDVRRVLSVVGGLFVIGVSIIGLLLLLLAPRWTFSTGAAVRESMLRSAVIGLVVLLALPPLAVLLMITVIGLPMAILLLLLYPLLLAFGYLVAAIGIGDSLARLARRDGLPPMWLRVPTLIVAVIALAAAAWIPYVGPWVAPLATLIGVGALLVGSRRRHV